MAPALALACYFLANLGSIIMTNYAMVNDVVKDEDKNRERCAKLPF